MTSKIVKKVATFFNIYEAKKLIKINMFIFLLLIQKLLIPLPKYQLILKACLVGKPTILKVSPNTNTVFHFGSNGKKR